MQHTTNCLLASVTVVDLHTPESICRKLATPALHQRDRGYLPPYAHSRFESVVRWHRYDAFAIRFLDNFSA